MRTLVCIKAVPSSTEVKMDPVTNTIIRDGKQSVVNPFDQAALEEAICIKEQLGGSIIVLSMGIPATEGLLRDCLSRGADRGILLSDRAFAGADTLATSYALSCALEQLRTANEFPSLIICGKMAVDGDTAQIGPELATTLGIPSIVNVEKVLAVSEEEITVRRITDLGREIVSCKLPALITVTKDIRIPRMPSIAGVRFGETGPVEVFGAQGVGADATRCGLNGSPTQVVRSFTPERTHEAITIEGTSSEQAAQLIDVLGGFGL
ncbi:MAG: electron transfer flavoprotein subunit beta/FixA family protein [Coriobacteriales bacterium]|nr:electron transfer flavoprotein subunit beta/FixA family protein [Coriobacteriales bacterium]